MGRAQEICKAVRGNIDHMTIVNNRLSPLKKLRIENIVETLEDDMEMITAARRYFVPTMTEAEAKETAYFKLLTERLGEQTARGLAFDRVKLLPDIRKNGLRVPIFIQMKDGAPILKDGFHRLMAMEALNKDEIDCLIFNDELRAQVKEGFPWGSLGKIYQPLEIPGYEDLEVVRPDSPKRAQAIVDQFDSQDKTFLDIGACSGFMSRYIIERIDDLEFFLNIDFCEHGMIAAFLMFLMRRDELPQAALTKWCCAVMDYKNLPAERQFDTVLNLSVFHHYFKTMKQDEIANEMRHVAGMTNRKLFIELEPTVDIVKSKDSEVMAIFTEGRLENFLLVSTGFKTLKNLGSFWHGRILYLLER